MDPWASFAPPGAAVMLEPGLVRVVAPNPSALTGPGTNTYLLGHQRPAVIDPGPDDARHLAALLDALAGRRVSHILVTHAHRDHSALAPALSRATGAPVLAFGGATAGRSAAMRRLAAAGLTGGGEGADTGFVADIALADGAELAGPAWRLQVLHTPGHMGGHLAFRWQDALFCGDTVLGWTSSLVSPPDGDMGQYMASLALLAAQQSRALFPGHGAPIPDPASRIAALTAHRKAREAAILAELARAPATLKALTAALHADTPASLWPAASRNVLAHLIDLAEKNLVAAIPDLRADASFRRL